ncbi:MEDS domain-containing protein [Blastococcus sp. CT_GayMR19]|uniref:MEDS domain-containing protein n=1 Tax=Blastococcus sp. CT_GayMR19 TaxID=2559608 RepID=UPI001431849D|nr:MEDS domain-containing protein [Blastococcus sp. CT_GayMR19]
MRTHGRVVEVPEPGPADHVCWVYDDPRDLATAAARFLAGGLARGERLMVVGDGMIESLDRDTLPFGGTDTLLATGALQVLDHATVYDGTGRFTPAQQLAFYDAAARKALDDGFTGLRVAAEVSALAADPVSRPALVRWEHLADDLMASGSGFTALCAYRADLGREALTEVASVHPVVRAPEGVPPFHVFHDRDRVVLTGSVDAFTATRLSRVLAESPAARPSMVLDLGRLEFVDVAGCRVLARWAQGLGGPLRVTGASGLVQRMWRLLGLDAVAPVTFEGLRA